MRIAREGERSTARAWCAADWSRPPCPITGAGDGRSDAECNADSVESLAGSATTPAGAESSDGCGDRRCGQQSR